VGSLLGALCGGFLLFYWLDLDQVYRVALAAVVLAATLVSVRILEVPRPAALALVALPLAIAIAGMPRWDVNRLASGAFRLRRPVSGLSYAGADRFFQGIRQGTRVVFYKDDPNSSVSVFEAQSADGGVDTAIATNAKPDGSVRVDYPTMALAALLPTLFAERAERAFVIGYGTGVTVGELAALGSMQRVTVAEISPGVIRAASHFEPFNQGALANPRTEVVVSDAYRALLRSGERYDIIVSEPSNPWVSGVEMLFSREFLTAARDRLRPGGVYAQWFHLYETDDAVVELVLRTYASVFDQVAVWYGVGPDLILLGFPSAEHALDVQRIMQRASEPEFAAALRRSKIASFPALLAHELLPLGVVNAAHLSGEVQTLLHPVLSQRAARAFFRGQSAELPLTLRAAPAAVGTDNSLLRRFAQLSGGRLSEPAHHDLTEQACRNIPTLCATLMADWIREYPTSPARDQMLERVRQAPPFAPHLGDTKLQHLVDLLTGGTGSQGSLTPEQARRLTDLFVEYYHHGTPFSRESLALAWRECRPSQAGDPGCRNGLEAAEARLGPLRSEVGGALPPSAQGTLGGAGVPARTGGSG